MPTKAVRPHTLVARLREVPCASFHTFSKYRWRSPLLRQQQQLRQYHISTRRDTIIRSGHLSRPCLARPFQQRSFSKTPLLGHAHLTPPKPGEERRVTIIDQQDESHEFKVADGDNLLDIAQSEELEMEGACGGSCACSTCHVIVQDQQYYDKMDEPDDDENDMLDLAFGLTETSRLGCQVKMSKDLDGLVVKLPSMTRNLQKSDFEKR